MNKQEMLVTIHSLEIQMEDSKENILKKITKSLLDQEIIEDSALFLEEVKKREIVGNTHIGHGAALVHLINQTVKQEGIYLYYFTNPVTNWHIDETQPIKLVIVYAIHDEESHHLIHFRKFSSLCADDPFMNQLVNQHISVEIIKNFISI